MSALEEYPAGIADNAILPLTEKEEFITPPSKDEAIASYWKTVGNDIRTPMSDHEPKAK